MAEETKTEKPAEPTAAKPEAAAAAAPKPEKPKPEKKPASETAQEPGHAAVEANVAAVKEPRSVMALAENRLKLVLSSHADIGNGWAAVTTSNTPFAHVLEPEFWAHTAYKLRPGDEITVHTDDMSYYGRLYVRSVSAPGSQRLNNRAIVSELERHEFGEVPAAAFPKDFEVKWMGPHQKWCVVSTKDQRVLKEGCGTKEEARQVLAQRLAA